MERSEEGNGARFGTPPSRLLGSGTMPSKMDRRANHEGTVERLPNGKYRARAWVKGVRVSSTTEPSKSMALGSLRRAIAELDRPQDERTIPTLADFVYDQLNGPLQKGPEKLAPTTWSLYETIYRTRLENHPTGFTPIDAVSRQDVEEWRDGLGVAPRSTNRYLSLVRMMLGRAKDQGYISVNPCDGVKGFDTVEAQVLTLSAAQVDKLLKLPMTERMERALRLCLHGLRRAEACGLRYEDFDGEGIWIKRQSQDIGGSVSVRRALKTKASGAWLPVDAQLKKLLAGGEGYVLATESGKSMSPRNLARDFATLIHETEFARIETDEGTFALTLHDLRATFGMRLLEAGVDIRTAAEMMRHSPEMLVKIYARSRRDLKKEAMQRLSAQNHPINHPRKLALAVK